ncbi:MAG TPA: hypothetical protein VFF09_02550 [archaeon]|nr:hypothetical protein [archaeon]
MDLDIILADEAALKKSIKKNCLLCMGRKHLGRNKNPERETVLKGLNEMYNVLNDKYDALRKTNAMVAQITNTASNKRAVLDIIDTCKGCDMEIDRANRGINALK